ncbi:spore germination protein [Bacillus sp. FJAT-50079]|uniref:spore germination protein n=1 Tax=Bacillus sp. FJAT-50079 TaxID=2833577 RepID=UPI002016A548|nr:spore germination protein [Bacillus sp. FJAT-50079]
MLLNDKMQTEVISWIIEELRSTNDFVQKPISMDEKQGLLLYIKTVVDPIQLQEWIIKPFFEMSSENHIAAYLSSLPQQQKIQSKKQMLMEMTKGCVVIVIHNRMFLLDIKKVNTSEVQETGLEQTLQGGNLGLSEDIETNINLIRKRYHQPSLLVEMFVIGHKNNQSLAIMYDNETVDQKVLEKVKKKIESLDKMVIQSSLQLQLNLNDEKRSLFPTMMITERTDRIIYNLAGGKIVFILDGNPFVIMAPVVFFDFIATAEDTYHSYWVRIFLVLLRYFGLFVCVVLPGLYVAIISFNPEVLRVELTLAIAGSRIGVPYPSFFEVLFMLIFMELLTEASIRLPKPISATATTVGGLILGTAATEAALTSNIMIIIVSAVAISTFVIPINEMSFSIRIVRFGILLFATIFGLAGLALASIGFIMYLTSIDSFGQPYLKLFIQRGRSEVQGVKR